MDCSVPVYTVCDESRYLIVKNVPALGCAQDLVKLFGSYGPIEEYRIMDEEESEPFTDIYWIKFMKITNARFAKRKLDDFSFLGNLLQVTYAPMYETLSDTKDKLDERQSVILRRIRPEKHGPVKRFNRAECSTEAVTQGSDQILIDQSPLNHVGSTYASTTFVHECQLQNTSALRDPAIQVQAQSQNITVSMNATVHAVRERLNNISSVGLQCGDRPMESLILSRGGGGSVEERVEQRPGEKKAGGDKRRRI